MATTHKNRKNSPQRTRTAKVKAHPRERRCFAPQESNQYAFLSECLNAIPVVDLPESNAAFGQSTNGNQIIWHLPEDIEIDARENIQYLQKGVQKYCLVHERSFAYEPSGNPKHDLCKLFELLQNCKPDNREISIDYDHNSNRLVFVEYELCSFEYYTLFFLPVRFYQKLPDRLKPLVADCLGYLICVCGLNAPSEHMDISIALGDWGVEMIDDILASEGDDEYATIYRETMESYNEGAIYELIKEVSGCPTDIPKMRKELDAALTEYSIDSPIWQVLKEIKNGIELHQTDNIGNYLRTPDSCTLEDYANNDNIIDFERLFAVVYDIFDPIAERAEESLNSDGGSLEIQGLYDSQIIDEQVKKELQTAKFTVRWCEWFNNFRTAIDKI